MNKIGSALALSIAFCNASEAATPTSEHPKSTSLPEPKEGRVSSRPAQAGTTQVRANPAMEPSPETDTIISIVLDREPSRILCGGKGGIELVEHEGRIYQKNLGYLDVTDSFPEWSDRNLEGEAIKYRYSRGEQTLFSTHEKTGRTDRDECQSSAPSSAPSIGKTTQQTVVAARATMDTAPERINPIQNKPAEPLPTTVSGRTVASTQMTEHQQNNVTSPLSAEEPPKKEDRTNAPAPVITGQQETEDFAKEGRCVEDLLRAWQTYLPSDLTDFRQCTVDLSEISSTKGKGKSSYQCSGLEDMFLVSSVRTTLKWRLPRSCLDFEPKKGRKVRFGSGWTGAVVQRVGENLRVIYLLHNSSAEQAGIRLGDIIEAIDDKPISKLASEGLPDDIKSVLSLEPNDSVTLTLLRDQDHIEVPLKVTQTPFLSLDAR